MEARIVELEKTVKIMQQEIRELRSIITKEDEAERPWATNTVEDWMIKLVYPGIYTQKYAPTAGFPQNRRKTVAQIKPGQFMFLYATTPIKRIIGLAKVTSSMKIINLTENRWPYSVDLEWVIGPKLDGVTLAQAGLDIRPRPGDTLYGISEDVAQEIIRLLKLQEDLTPDQLDLMARQYRDLYREPVTHEQAVSKLREAGEEAAADELEAYYAADGTRRGWDEFASKGSFHAKYPQARRIIWPNTYND
jgi:hypothetical protein